MANTLTSLIPDLYEALDVVSRELTGFIPAVTRDSSIERAALNENVLVPITQSFGASASNTAGVTAPDTGNATVDNVAVTISKSKHQPVRWNGEETKGLGNAGTFSTIQADRFFQAMRSLVNEIETDLWTEAYQSASRAFGAAGTAPFGTAGELDDFAGVLRILEENGAPTNDLQLVLGHAAISNLRGKQSTLFKVNEAGSDDMLRNGMTDRVMKMAIRHSDVISVHTPGSAFDDSPTYLIDQGSPGELVGQTTLTVDTGASGTMIPGDIVNITNDANRYVVNTALAAGDVVIGKPGLREIAVDDEVFEIGVAYTPNVAFARHAIILATRAPAMPEGGDMATDTTTIVDPRTGLSFEIAEYKQYLQTVYHVRLAWGFKVIKEEHVAILIG